MESKAILSTSGPCQKETDEKNAQFWDDLCGSQLAKTLGIIDNSPASLKKFDDWYFEFYPYLSTHVPFDELDGKSVLEVGVGYGTVSQKIGESGAEYHGLDIAKGPVDMVNLRIGRGRHGGVAKVGNILAAPYRDESFDWVIAIGCLHHTGNLALAIDEVYRVLKKSGQAMIMVYSATSYRQFQRAPFATFWRLMSKSASTDEVGGTHGDQKARRSYDTNTSGEVAPETAYVSAQELRHLCGRFSKCAITHENIGQDGIFKPVPRSLALKFGKFLGLDIYCNLTK